MRFFRGRAGSAKHHGPALSRGIVDRLHNLHVLEAIVKIGMIFGAFPNGIDEIPLDRPLVKVLLFAGTNLDGSHHLACPRAVKNIVVNVICQRRFGAEDLDLFFHVVNRGADGVLTGKPARMPAVTGPGRGF